jgi:RimJ/RimL family protein N-acetyltransferase
VAVFTNAASLIVLLFVAVAFLSAFLLWRKTKPGATPAGWGRSGKGRSLEGGMSPRMIPIEEKHADGFHACLDRVAKERKFLLFQEAPSLESTRSFVRENVATGQVQWVVVDRDRVVGWCDILRPQMASLSHVGSVGMGLLPEYRGKGIGRALLQRTLQAAFASGIERIELSVFASNRKAMSLYRSLGFVEEGRMARRVKLGDAYQDMFCMVLFNDSGAP